MTHSFDIGFDPRSEREERAWRLDLVITPIDDFTGRVIVRGVTATIPRQRMRARRSLSGHLFVERWVPAEQQFSNDKHSVHIDPKAAGYFAPSPNPIEIETPQENRNTRILRLIRRPDTIEDGVSMIVRGSVVRQGNGDPVDGQVIEGRIAGIADPFRTRTNERGNFALRLRPPSPILGADPVPVPITADVTLSFVDARNPGGVLIPDTLLTDVEDMRTRVLPEQVEIP